MKILALIPPTLILAASYAEHSSLAQENCKDDRPYGACIVEGTPANPMSTFNKQALTMNPKALCTEPGAEVEIRITPRRQSPPDSIRIVAKDDSNEDWLRGSNDDPDNPDTIRIKIPDDVADGNYDFYVVDEDTGQCLDPRWEVNRGR